MASVFLSDILKRNGLNPEKVKLIRHSLNHKRFEDCYRNGFMDEYQKLQTENFFKNCDYILVFISGPGTSAKYIGCYKVGAGVPAELSLMKEGFLYPNMFGEENYYHDLIEVDLLSDLKNRLIINWGKSTVSWHQWAKNEKEVLAIQENPKLIFSGYENIILSYSELKEIVEDSILYENWHTALSSVYAIYLIVDTVDGKQYIGSAYGSGGLLERWKNYVISKHGNNKFMIELIRKHSDRYKDFQFSILQILPKTITNEEVINIETLYKRKLCTKSFGMNEN